MSQSTTRLEQIAQIAFILACVVLSGVALFRFGWTPSVAPSPNSSAMPLKIGITLDKSSPLVDDRQATALIVVSSRCRYCIDSLPLYRRLVEASSTNSFRVVFAGTEALDTTTGFLIANGHVNPTVVELPPAIQVSVTPTLILIDKSGKVTNFWLGRLGQQQEDQLFTMVSAGGSL